MFLRHFNRVTIFDKANLPGNTVYVDACLTGVGGSWNNRVYSAPIPQFALTPNIAHLEILNVVVALRIWDQDWTHSTTTVFCDNHAVVQAVNSGRARDLFIAKCLRHIWFIASVYDIDFKIEHIPGQHNTLADTLSRLPTGKTIDSFTDVQEKFIWDEVERSWFLLDVNL